ncbi:MAG: hypothetical protein DHS20C17_35290 [Cyclobacteriaceae bacterium]|nr:MAG: hypothetical protein DHS20C17_35290 [Cyclobacteriaceae bacterium]
MNIIMKLSGIIKSAVLVSLLFAYPTGLWAQKYISYESKVSFFSEAPLENIEAVNSSASSILNLENGEIVFSVPIRGFEFRKSLMQTHFNENYMESEIYPKSTFKGKVSGFRPEPGKYSATAVGELAIHGVTRKVEITGNIEIGPNELTLLAKFPVKLEDHNIKIPKLLFSNIAETVEVTIEFNYRPYVTN